MFYKKMIILEFLGQFNLKKIKLNEQKKKFETQLLEIESKNEQINEPQKNIEKIIEEFLKFENFEKIYLYRLINKIEIDKDKNIYIYFNFSKDNLDNLNFIKRL